MIFTITFLVIMASLIFKKLIDISKRNKLNSGAEKRLLSAGGLLILFYITHITLPYPQSLYWFIFLGVILLGSILCFNIIKVEIKRFKTLGFKEQIKNVLFYSLFIMVTHIYL